MVDPLFAAVGIGLVGSQSAAIPPFAATVAGVIEGRRPPQGPPPAVWAALIGVSTPYTKQHYVADVIVGALAAWVAYLLFLRGYPREAVPDADRRLAPMRALAAAGIFAIMVAGFWVAYLMGMVVS